MTSTTLNTDLTREFDKTEVELHDAVHRSKNIGHLSATRKSLYELIDDHLREIGLDQPFGNPEDSTPLISRVATEAKITDEPISKEALAAERAEAENKKRVALLVRKYVREKLTSEENARLNILNEKISILMPRVSFDQIEHVASVNERLRKVSSGLDDLLKKLE